MLSLWLVLSFLWVAVSAFTTNGNSFSVDMVRNDAFIHNGPAEYRWAHMKYGQTLPEKYSKVAVGEVGAWNQSYDREYLSPIMLGTPPQMCFLDIDTGSADLWLFSTDTPRIYLDGQRIYHPDKSETATVVGNATWSISYGDGSYAGGDVYRDNIYIGNVTITNGTIETATSVSMSLTTDPVLSGILGLSINRSSTIFPDQPTILSALSPELEEDLFAVDLKYEDMGQWHFGYINDSSYTGEMTWQPLVQGAGYWQFYLQVIHIGGTSTWMSHNWPVVADTGTTLLLLQPDLVKMYWDQVPGASESELFGGWVYPCNATLPDFNFGFDGGWNATVPGHYFNFQNVSDTECYGGIQESSMPDFGIVGDAFLKALYVVFNTGNSTIGLASKELTA